MLDMILYAPVVLAGASFTYILFCLVALLRFRARLGGRASPAFRPPVTVLKPICGLDHEMVENLRSFCRQDYGEFQVVFGVGDTDDPAIPLIRQIIKEFPEHDLALVVDSTVVGSNLKVSNLINMYERARHDIIVVADSDMRVRPDYLQSVAAPFADPSVGAATCVYSGRAAAGLASRLGAMFVNDWFLPSALIPAIFGRLTYCFGATMAIRRCNLEEFGSFGALANILADDYMLGRFVHEQGHRIALVPYIVENIIQEPDLKALFRHELRWARTIRSVEPLAYAGSAVTEVMVWGALAAAGLYAALGSLWIAGGMLSTAIVLRLLLHIIISSITRGRATPWLMPVRDVMSPVVRIAGYFGSTVTWRKHEFVIVDEMHLELADGQRAYEGGRLVSGTARHEPAE